MLDHIILRSHRENKRETRQLFRAEIVHFWQG